MGYLFLGHVGGLCCSLLSSFCLSLFIRSFIVVVMILLGFVDGADHQSNFSKARR